MAELKAETIGAVQQITRVRALFRRRPFDTTTEQGRSKERYRRAAMTTLASGAARVIAMLASLITVPLTFRYLGAERYGLWMVLISIISVMSFADLGIGNGLINAISEAYGKDDRALARQYLTSAFVLLLGIGLIVALAGAAAYPFMPWMRLFNVKSVAVAAEGAQAFLVLYYWFAISIPLGVITRAQAGLQQGYLPQIVAAVGSILSLLGLLGVIALHGGLALLVFASTFGTIVATLVNGWILFREHPWLVPAWHAFHTGSAAQILKLGLMFFVLQCAFSVAYTSDNIVITEVLGAAAVAAYAVPQKLFSFVPMVVGMAILPLWPAYGEAIARGDVNWLRRAFLGSLALTLAISVPICSLLAAAGPWILRVAVGKSLHSSMSLLIVLALWGCVSAVSLPMGILLNGAGVLKPQTVIAVITSLTNLALSILLTRRFGVIGVCCGSILTQLLIAFPAFFFVIRNTLRKLARVSVPVEIQDSSIVVNYRTIDR